MIPKTGPFSGSPPGDDTSSQGRPANLKSDMSRTAPGLLLAMPSLRDPNFEKTVVLMLEHTAQGALGLVVNRPTKLKITEVFASLESEWRGDPDALVFNGGPVMREIGWILHEPVELPDGEPKLEIVPGLELATSPERLRVLAEDPPERIRFLLGAAGWGPSQLEGEITEGAWMTAEISLDLLFTLPPEQMWTAAFRALGIDPAMLVECDGVH